MNLRWASCGEMLQGALFFLRFFWVSGAQVCRFLHTWGNGLVARFVGNLGEDFLGKCGRWDAALRAFGVQIFSLGICWMLW